MTSRTRFWLVGMLACAMVGASVGVGAPAALGAPEFGVEKFFAGNCETGHETCAQELVGPYSFPKEPSLAEAEANGYTQAGGHVPYGVTHFKVKTKGTVPNMVPEGIVTHIRTDVAPGLSTNPTAVPQCSREEFGATEALPGSGFYAAPTCHANTKIGKNDVVVYAGAAGDLPISGSVYNLVQPEGRSSSFGVALELPIPFTEAVLNGIFHGTQPGIEKAQYFAHTLIEGNVEWGKEAKGTNAGDYHDYFEIDVSPTLPLISSRLVFYGRSGGDFVTNATRCPGDTTTTLSLTDSEGTTVRRPYTPPVSLTGCGAVPFQPAFSLTPETTQSDATDGILTELTVPHASGENELDSSQLRTGSFTLPEGMTLNPSAARGLTACTPAQARIHSEVAGTGCPISSSLGSVRLDVPDLPPGSLIGNVYLGGPESGPIAGPPYTIYLDAESKRYGVSVRLQGEATPNATTGRVTTTFSDNPEQPFSNLVLRFRGEALAPIANPLVCGVATTETNLIPYAGGPAQSPFSKFTVDGNGKGAACPAPLPFALTQATENVPSAGGQASNFTLHLKRSDGQQYLSSVSTSLPPGLVGKIPAVPLCPEPGASTGNCPAASQIGRVATEVGSGPSPVGFAGNVYLTGPTGKGPYGMTMVVPAVVGPFSLGNVVARAAIEIDQHTGRVTVTGEVPTIWAGIPLRLKELTVAINRQGFLINPTNCGALATQSRLGAQQGGTQTVSTPYQASGCSSLAFKPKFGASTGGKTSRANGASLVTKLNFHPKGAEANVKSVVVSLPKALPSRLSTLNHACTEAVFNANPNNCPGNSKVGVARVKTPTLPGQLSGLAYFVSHGGAKFPDLDLVLDGDGVRIVLVGNTNIDEKTNVTTTSFVSPPDVPFTGFELNLPAGPNSAVGANGNLCKQSLVMPTTITAQNGKVVKQNTPVAVTGCPVTVLSRFTHNRQAVVTVKAPSAGRVSGRGANLSTRYAHPSKAQKVTLRLPLAKAVGHRAIRVRIGFIPKSKKERSSVAYTTVVF